MGGLCHQFIKKNTGGLPMVLITIGAGERGCVVGPNGKGKSTLLKLLAGRLQPQTGDIVYHPAVTKGFFEQTNVSSLVDSHTVEQEILHSNPDVSQQLARNICGAMMFSGDDALKKISILSGGEKSRVMLGKLLATPVNLLLLDEPTNHLDMESCDAMLAAIDNFDGGVIIVTHNEMFLHALAKRLIVFQNDEIEVFEGSYQRFLDTVGWNDDHQTPEKPGQNDSNSTINVKQTKKDQRRRRSEIITRRSKIITPLQRQITKIETQIETREKKISDLNHSMQLATQERDGQRIAELSQALHLCQSDIDRLFDDLESVTDEFEQQSAAFQEQLDDLQ